MKMYLTKINIKDYRLRKIFKKLYEISKDCTKFYSPKSFRYYYFFIFALRLYLKKGFNPKEVFSLGLFNSKIDENELNKHTSFSNMVRVLNPLNPSSWQYLVGNKDLFYKYCQSINLPVPKLLAIINKNASSMSCSRIIIKNSEDWVNFIKEGLPDEFVIKPSKGAWGECINIYKKTNSGVVDGFGNLQSEEDIYINAINNTNYDSFIVQERLKIHPDFLQISPSENVHCVRIITLIDSLGLLKILHGQLNLITGKNFVSQEGNLKIAISTTNGRLEHGVLINKKKGGYIKVTQHPETGVNFKGFKIPLWDEVISLSEEVANKFLPLRSVGWDFVITETGVKLLEANAPYGPPNYFRPMDKFIKTLIKNSEFLNQQ